VARWWRIAAVVLAHCFRGGSRLAPIPPSMLTLLTLRADALPMRWRCAAAANANENDSHYD